MLKSIGVVLGSYILSVILVLGSDLPLMHIFPGDFAKGHIPSTNALLASTGCFIIASLICAWVCARFAPAPSSKHVLAFAILGEVMGAGMTLPQWNSGWPHWYFLSWLLTWPISCWIGWKLGARDTAAQAATA